MFKIEEERRTRHWSLAICGPHLCAAASVGTWEWPGQWWEPKQSTGQSPPSPFTEKQKLSEFHAAFFDILKHLSKHILKHISKRICKLCGVQRSTLQGQWQKPGKDLEKQYRSKQGSFCDVWSRTWVFSLLLKWVMYYIAKQGNMPKQ